MTLHVLETLNRLDRLSSTPNRLQPLGKLSIMAKILQIKMLAYKNYNHLIK